VSAADDDSGRAPGRRVRRRLAARGFGTALLLGAVLASGAPGQERMTAIPPGLGMGASIGMQRFGGDANAPIASAPSWEFHVGGGLRNGLFARIGGSLSRHDIATGLPHYQLMSFFVEPRWVALGVASRWAPFVAGRVGWTKEQVVGRPFSLRASGSLLGAGGGAVVRLAPQIALEGGVLFGRTSFDAYTFRGDQRWKACLDGLDPGTGLPLSAADCADAYERGPLLLCFPPYFYDTRDCDPPKIPYDGTSRTGSGLRAWIGINLSFSTELRRR